MGYSLPDSVADCFLGGRMKYNLIPQERRKNRYTLLQRNHAAGMAVLTVVCLLFWVAGTLIQNLADTERTRFMTQSLPLQQRVSKENTIEKKLKQRTGEITSQEKKRIHWAGVLVMLARTKPEELEVERLEVRQNRCIVYGKETAGQAALQTWQDKLRRESLVKRVFASQKRIGAADEFPVFQVEVELAYEEAVEPSVPTS